MGQKEEGQDMGQFQKVVQAGRKLLHPIER